MKLFRMCSLTLCCALFLTGCLAGMTTSSSLSQEGLQKNLVVGKTTKAEVKKIYGEPTSVKKRKSGDVWVYMYDPAKGNSVAAGVAQSATSAAVAEGTSRATLAGIKAGGMAGGLVAADASTRAGSVATSSVDKAFPRDPKKLTVRFNKFDIVNSYNVE